YRFYTRVSYKFKRNWMFHLFSRNIWYLIFSLYALAIAANFVKNSTAFDESDRPSPSMSPHVILNLIFQYFCALCSQGGELYQDLKTQRVLSFSIGMFSRFILTSYSSMIYILMTRTERIRPFTNFETLFYETDYSLLIVEGSGGYSHFLTGDAPIINLIMDSDRMMYYNNYDSMWEAACTDQKHYAAFHYTYDHQMKNVPCEVEPVGTSHFDAWAGAGIHKNSPYRKSINHGIIKLREVGIIDLMLKRCRLLKSNGNDGNTFSPISLDQIYYPGFTGWLCSGSVMKWRQAAGTSQPVLTLAFT
ncbi:hypothetical protein QAD02_016915, partial [Eretmocerus hayati]